MKTAMPMLVLTAIEISASKSNDNKESTFVNSICEESTEWQDKKARSLITTKISPRAGLMPTRGSKKSDEE